MDVPRALDDRRLREPGEFRRQGLPKRGAARLDRALDDVVVRCLGRVGGPALAIAADPGRGLQLPQRGDRLLRPCTEQRVVATEQELGGAGLAGVVEHGAQRRQVAVHVVEEGSRGHRLT
jgi:hypothetical protein